MVSSVGWLACVLLSVAFSIPKSTIEELNAGEKTFRRAYISETSRHNWIGTLAPKLTVFPTNQDKIDVHMVVLISKALCVASARDIVALDPGYNRTNAYFFFEDGQMWFCPVDRYLVHPDHALGKRNTIALVYLHMPNARFRWIPIQWTVLEEAPEDAWIVGITSQHKAGYVEQFQEYVDKTDCAGYDSDQEYACYKQRGLTYRVCEYLPSMALLEVRLLVRYLVGISAGGPGCFAPSQWVLISPFKAWIANHSLEPMPADPEPDQGMYDYYEDLDLQLLSKLDQPLPEMTNVSIHPGSRLPLATNQTELVLGGEDGECTSGELLYRDATRFKTLAKGNIGTYSVSLFDTNYPTFSCVSLLALCKKKSLTRFWIQKGFSQEDIEFYIRQIPYTTNRTIARKVVFLMDAYRQYHDDITGNLEFLFEFDEEATLHVQFRGRVIHPAEEAEWRTYPGTPPETSAAPPYAATDPPRGK